MPFLPHEEVCPISEQLLFSLYDAAKRGLPPPVSDVPPGSRSSLAIFCYRRSHLEKAGLAVAAICNEEELVAAGGLLGRSLFVKSRNTGSGAGNSPQPKLGLTGQISAEPSDDEQDEALQAE